MSASLVGSEMCIRDSPPSARSRMRPFLNHRGPRRTAMLHVFLETHRALCLLYTSDAADDM
eukprot:3448954-Alexandrium_andersonii.AAC.1